MEIILSSLQKSVVDFDGNFLLVVAGAGSGKTRVLTERIKKTIGTLKHGEKILAITFSNKATEELRDRLILTLGNEVVEKSTYIGTIHKFCLDIVTSRSNAIGLPDDLQICDSSSDRLKIFVESIKSVPEVRDFIMQYDQKDAQKKIMELLEVISKSKRDMKLSNDYFNKPILQKLIDEYDTALLKQGVIDFDDILRYAYQILIETGSVTRVYRSIYKNIFIDEAQDLNKAQYEVIKILCGDKTKLTMVGDPNQSIFGFNGSSNEYLTNLFVKDFNAVRITLNENYRSSKSVLEAANKLEPTFEAHGVCVYTGEFSITAFKNELEEATYIHDKILSLTKNGHPDVESTRIVPRDIIVIARNRYVFSCLEDILTQSKIEYMMKASAKGSFSSESEFIKAFELGMRLLVNNKDLIHLDELSKVLHIDQDFISFTDLRKATSQNDIFCERMVVLNKAWDIFPKDNTDLNFGQIVKKLRDILLSQKIVIDENEKILINDDIDSWEENWNSFIKNSSVGERSLVNFVRNASLGSSIPDNNNGITLSTVHMSKGLEFNVVFIMGLDEGVFPDYRAVNSDREGNKSAMIEEKHNLFVAITRSKRLCYITYPLEKKTPWGVKTQYPSRFINILK